MGIWFVMLICDLLCPAIMLGTGIWMMKDPPRKINALLGYRTTMSMKNDDTWDFANRYAGTLYWKWGLATLAVTVIVMLFLLGKRIDTISMAGSILMFLQLIPIVGVIPFVEIALGKNFDQNGNRKEKG